MEDVFQKNGKIFKNREIFIKDGKYLKKIGKIFKNGKIFFKDIRLFFKNDKNV